MSSTGLIDFNANYINSDIIDVNEKLTVNNIDILELINNNFYDLSENIQDLSQNVINKITDLSQNVINKITDLSENIQYLSQNVINKINDLSQNVINKITDLSGNIQDLSQNAFNKINDLSQNTFNKINDLSGNIQDLSQNTFNKITDLSGNVKEIKDKNDAQGVTILGHSLQIQGNSNAIAATDALLAPTVVTTGSNTAAITAISATIGIPSILGTPSTGLYAGIDSKTSRSLFGSGNVAINSAGFSEYINLVYNNDHFEDINLIGNRALNLKEPYKSLPTTLNDLSNVVNTKQDNLLFTTPLIKNDVSNNITIDLSGYALINSLNASNVTSGTLPISRGGIGTTTLTANQILIGNTNTSILQSANLTWNNISNTLSATNFIGAGSAITNLNVSNAASGTLTISRGGIGTTALTANQILIGNAATSILQSANLSWDNTTNTLSATNFIGSGSAITNLNVSNVASGTLTISRGGIGTTSLTANQILIGNTNTSILQSANLTWNNISNTLSASNFVGSGSGITNLDYNKIATNKPDLSVYAIKSNVDTSLNSINTTLTTKEQILTFSTPLTRTSNTIGIDLSAYPLKTYVDGSLNTINTNKQNNLTFSNPFLNTSNTISLKYNSAQFTIDASSNLNLISSIASKWITSGTNIYFSTGNVGIGTITPSSKITINDIVYERGAYDHSTSPLTITNQTATGVTINDPQSILNLCRQGSGGYSFGARATLKLCRYENVGVNSRTRMDIVISNNRYDEELNVMSLKGNGNVGIGTTNPQSALEVLGTIAATAFSGDGANITNVSYTNITGKPTNFQSDWTSTIINKPVIYTQTETNNLLATKQNNLTFSNPFLNTSNTISLKFNTAQFNIDASGNLLLVSGIASQWTTTGTDIYYNSGNVGINTTSLISGIKLDCRGTIYSHGLMIGDINTITANSNNVFTPGNYQLLINPPTGTAGASIQTIKQGTGYNQNLVFQGSGGNVGIGNITPEVKLDVNGSLLIRAFGTSNGGTSGIFFRNGYSTSGYYNCSILTYDHNADTFSDGISINGFDGVSICTGANTRQERMRINIDGNVGISNTTPKLTLDIGSTNGNHNIGRAILTAGNIHNTDKLDSLSIGRWDGSNTTDWQFSGIRYNVTTGTAVGEGASNHSNMAFWTWGNNISNTREVMRLTSRGRLGINTTAPTEFLDVNGNIKCSQAITTGDFNSFLGGLRINGNDTGNTLYNDTRQLGITALNNIIFNTGTNLANYTTRMLIDTNGNIKCTNSFGINTTSFLSRLTVRMNYNDGNTGGFCIDSSDPAVYNLRIFSYVQAGSQVGYHFQVNNIASSVNAITLNYDGGVNIGNYLTVQKDITLYGNIRLYANPSTGSSGTFSTAGYVICNMYSIANSGTDLLGTYNVASVNSNNPSKMIYIMFDTFTGFHRCFTEDIEFDKENPQKFKDDYMGRIVISTGKIATDTKENDNNNDNITEWEIKYDKEGITIEDALPMVELSRKKKDKRVFGVLGLSTRNNSRAERLIINSVGEGAIYVINSNGNIDNGDYITSSDYLGYGEKQDEIFLCNYTVAKATIDCSFELDSPYYNCYEIEEFDINGNKLRVAFIACTYHCG
jgi:hypothetical protein